MADRRRFIKQVGGAFALAALPGMAASCAGALPVYDGAMEGGRIVIPWREASSLRQPGGLLVVRSWDLLAPVVLRNVEGVGIVALSTVCSHAGCEVRPMPRTFECPCHGSVYHADGTVKEGPASAPLQRLRVSEQEDVLIVELSR